MEKKSVSTRFLSGPSVGVAARGRSTTQQVRPGLNTLNRRVDPIKPIAGYSERTQLAAKQSPLESNGFSREESSLLKEAIRLAKFEHLDGQGYILIRSSTMEARLRRGGVEGTPHWAVISIPLFNMNSPSAVEICLHFLAEAYNLAHAVDFSMQVGINMETEHLEVLMPLPLREISPSQLGGLLGDFVEELYKTIQSEIDQVLKAGL